MSATVQRLIGFVSWLLAAGFIAGVLCSTDSSDSHPARWPPVALFRPAATPLAEIAFHSHSESAGALAAIRRNWFFSVSR
jgi:hypothetical protein